jgi:hypothetical protein
MTVTDASMKNGKSHNHGDASFGTKLIHVGSDASEETGAVSCAQ